jgi:hypothetical protein
MPYGINCPAVVEIEEQIPRLRNLSHRKADGPDGVDLLHSYGLVSEG